MESRSSMNRLREHNRKVAIVVAVPLAVAIGIVGGSPFRMKRGFAAAGAVATVCTAALALVSLRAVRSKLVIKEGSVGLTGWRPRTLSLAKVEKVLVDKVQGQLTGVALVAHGRRFRIPAYFEYDRVLDALLEADPHLREHIVEKTLRSTPFASALRVAFLISAAMIGAGWLWRIRAAG